MSQLFSLLPIDAAPRSLKLMHSFQPLPYGSDSQLVPTLPRCIKTLRKKDRLFESEYNLKIRASSSDQGSSSRNLKLKQILQPKPRSKYCQICKEAFQDYLQHVNHPVHIQKVQEADAELDWEELAQKALNNLTKQNQSRRKEKYLTQTPTQKSNQGSLKRAFPSLNSIKSIPSSYGSKKRMQSLKHMNIFENNIQILNIHHHSTRQLEGGKKQEKLRRQQSSDSEQEEEEAEEVVIVNIKSSHNIGIQRRAVKRYSQFRNFYEEPQEQCC